MLIQSDALTRVGAAIFEAAGSTPEEAACVARHLVDSNLCGHDSHGVIRISRYIAFVKNGRVSPGKSMSIVNETPTMALLDGNFGFGQVIGEEAVALVAKKAKTSGIAMVTMRRAGHLGRLGEWGEMLAAHGLISLQFLNTTGMGMMVTPFGGSDRRLSPSPMAICVPMPGQDPILLDITTAASAEGKLFVAKNKGQPVPPNTIIDKDGNPTTDARDFYAGGAILPVGGHKGSGLNILTDILSGALSGGGCTAPGAKVLENTWTVIAFDPSPLVDRDAFAKEVIRFRDWVTASPPATEGGEVLFPGEVEFRNRAARGRDGIPLDDTTWEEILTTGEGVGLARADLEAMAG